MKKREREERKERERERERERVWDSIYEFYKWTKSSLHECYMCDTFYPNMYVCECVCVYIYIIQKNNLINELFLIT